MSLLSQLRSEVELIADRLTAAAVVGVANPVKLPSVILEDYPELCLQALTLATDLPSSDDPATLRAYYRMAHAAKDVHQIQQRCVEALGYDLEHWSQRFNVPSADTYVLNVFLTHYLVGLTLDAITVCTFALED